MTTRSISTEKRPIVVMGFALFAASFAAVMIRLTQNAGMPSFLIATLRMLLASLVLLPIIWARYRHELSQLTRAQWLWAIFAGFWLGLHFLAIMVSLEHITVLIHQVIIGTGPLWVALLETTFLKEQLNKWVWIGLSLAIVGGMVIAFAGATGNNQTAPEGANPVFGMFLGILGAIAASIYLTVGRKVRPSVSVLPYVWIVYLFGGLTALVAVIITQTPILGHPSESYFWVVVLTLFPHLVGHTGFNYAVGYAPATLVSLSGQIVVVSAGFVAFLLFGELPLPLEVVGSVIIICGVMLAILKRNSARKRKS